MNVSLIINRDVVHELTFMNVSVIFMNVRPYIHECKHYADNMNVSFMNVTWWYRSTTGRTFAGRSGLVSGEIYERETAASVDATKGRDPNQQKPHFELDGMRAQAAGQALTRHAGWARSRPAYLDGSLRSLRRLQLH